MKKLYDILKEARIVPKGIAFSGGSSDHFNQVNSIISKVIANIISDNNYYRNNMGVVEAMFEDRVLGPLVEKYIKSKMIETNAEIVRGGESDIVTRANVSLLTDKELLEFVEDNKEVQLYLARLFWKSYLDSLDINDIRKLVSKYYGSDYENEFSYENIEDLIYHKLNDEYYGTDSFPDSESYFASNEFSDYAQRELQKNLLEARVIPVGGKKLEPPTGWEEWDKSSIDEYNESNYDEDAEEFGYDPYDPYGKLIEAYEAPMEGWDDNHPDVIYIFKKIDNKFNVMGNYAFGDFISEGEYNSLYEAQKRALELMEELKKGWDEIEEAKIIPVGVGSMPQFIPKTSPRAIILTDVYYIYDDADRQYALFRGSTAPAYELGGMADIDYNGQLYIEDGERGWYDEEKEMFESQKEHSTTRVEKEYIKLI